MALNLRDCRFTGPAFPEPFVQLELEKELARRGLLSRTTGEEGRQLGESWQVYRRKLRELVLQGGSIRVRNHVIEPLVSRLGYEKLEQADDVQTREGSESGGCLLTNPDGSVRLRTWSVDMGVDLDAPARRGAAYRYSHVRIAQRVLLACGERLGLVTNGVELRILISDPARPDSQIEIPIDSGWKRSRDVPDSFRLLLALASPNGLQALTDLIEKARLQQTKVTRELRYQARRAVEQFVQEVLDHPANRDALTGFTDRQQLARELWREGLIVVYRLLFILKLESNDDAARSFSFASTSLWRNSFSPTTRLAGFARQALAGSETGALLEHGLRALFRMFTEGLQCTELNVQPLGGALFGEQATPILSRLTWGERAVAYLLDQLLWTPKRRGSDARERVHYGPLDVEDLGRVYEALLELEPGVSTEPMCRLRRAKLEVVVPVAQGERYRSPSEPGAPATGHASDDTDSEAEEQDDAEEEVEEESGPRRGGTRVEWIEEVPPNRFYLRVGLGRKATGSYYTPHSFVRFLVQETLGPQVAERSPHDDPKPLEILKLKVLDPAMGSGHFLVEACRFLGTALYEACRLCDEKALEAERKAENARRREERETLLAEATQWRQRVVDLPDPNDELVQYLPSRSPEGEESGLSQRKAQALCRRMVAVHCLYGVDKNPLAVELAKLSLWIEAHAEGLPLTFMDHRLVLGDSLTGPFWDKLKSNPGSGTPVADLFRQQVDVAFGRSLGQAIDNVRHLDATVGATLTELADKRRLKAELDRALWPFRIVAAAWSGGVMIGPSDCDDAAYGDLVRVVAQTGDLPDHIESERLRRMIARGLGVTDAPESREAFYALLESGGCTPAVPYDLTFPEVFYPTAVPFDCRGFDALLGNPPWNKANLEMPEYMGSIDFRFLEVETNREREELITQYRETEAWANWMAAAQEEDQIGRAVAMLAPDTVSEGTGFGAGHADIFAPFIDRSTAWLRRGGVSGMVLPSALHVSRSLSRLRRKLLKRCTIRSYYCFENKRGLFEIHKSWKYSPAVFVHADPPTPHVFSAQFYLHHDTWLFAETQAPPPFHYDAAIVEQMDAETLTFQEFRSEEDMRCARAVFANSVTWASFGEANSWRIRRELNATDDRWRIDERTNPPREWSPSLGGLIHHKPGTIHQYTDEWPGSDVVLVPLDRLRDRSHILELGRFYRAAYRMTARATDERTSIYALLPPGTTATNTVPIEGEPQGRPNSLSIAAVGVCNSFVFDWSLRLRVGSKTVSKFIMEVTPFPQRATTSLVLTHGVLRLVCNHGGYEPLWREQVGNEWREDKPPFTWPVLEGDDERLQVRAAIDAVVADAYGLNREQYEHVLSTFSHSSYRRAPELCLARFDELKAIGLEAFTRRYDPYWDIPLNENLPQPVIDLPIPQQGSGVRGPESGNAGQLHLWQERDGQLTMVSPGPLFDEPGTGGQVAGSGEDSASTFAEHAPAGRRARRGRRPRSAAATGTGEADERAYAELLAYLRNQGTITSADAQELLGLTATQVRPLLQRLVAEGHAASEGGGRGTRYCRR